MSVPDCFERQAALCRDRPALASGDWQPTYDELNAAANRLARVVLTHGTPGDRVALLMGHDTPLVAATLAVLKAGRVIVVLNPGEPPARLGQILDDARPTLLLSDARHLDLAWQIAGPRCDVVSGDDHLHGPPAANLGLPLAPDDLAWIIYTSGSTGRPKGVMQTHRNLIHNARRVASGLGLTEHDRLVLLASPSGGAGVGAIWCGLLTGASLCPFPVAERGVLGLADWLRERRITCYVSSASVFRHFMKTLDPDETFPLVRVVRLGSEPATSDDFEAFRRHFPECAALYHMLSSSETGNVTRLRLTPRDSVPPGRLAAGDAADGLEVLLCDDDGREVAAGEVGEIVVKSEYLSPGYWRNDALTAERFSGPHGPTRVRLFRSGDLARRGPDGSLVVTGRKDARVKVRGYRIEPAEVEDAILGLPQVTGAVVGTRDRKDGEPELIAYVTTGVPRPDAEAVRRGLRGTLPSYMIPSNVVLLDQFPLTPHGKVDRARLRQLVEETDSHPEEATTTETEARLAAIWSEALNAPVRGRHDNFFDKGGDSLIAAVIAARVRTAWAVDLELKAFVDHPTLCGLAALIDKRGRLPEPNSLPPVVKASRSAALPLSFGQERIWKFSRTPESSAGYVVACAHRLSGPLDVALFRDCVDELSRRHEILRTTFAETDGTPRQCVHDPEPEPVPLVDVSASADPEAEARSVFREAARRTFDLARLPLLSLTLVRLREGEHWLVRVNHHINSDGWSWVVYFRQLGELYEARLRGESWSGFAAESLQFADYAVWERDVLRLDGPHYRDTIDWWRRQWHDAPAAVPLPFARPEPRPDAAPADGVIDRDYDHEVGRRLDALARREGTTLFVTGLAAFAALLADQTCQPDVVLGAYATNRDRAEVQDIFGFFSNLVALRFRGDPEATFRDCLAAARDIVVEARSRSLIPYEQVCDELRSEGVVVPEVRAIFSVVDYDTPSRFGDVELTRIDRHYESMPWGFSLGFVQNGGRQFCRAVFDARQYDPARVSRFLDRLVGLLDAASRDADLTLAQLLATGQDRPALQARSDWADWHKHYDRTPSLQARLVSVRRQVVATLDELPAGAIKVVSVCAGDGRDLIGALAKHRRRDDVTAALLDIDAASLTRGREMAAAAGLGDRLQFVEADASLAASYVGWVPADVIIVSGVLGHLPHDDVARLIESLPMLCKAGGVVVWSRHVLINDGETQIAAIREGLRKAGFAEVAFEVASPNGFAVGRCRFTAEPLPLDLGRTLFEFVGIDNLR